MHSQLTFNANSIKNSLNGVDSITQHDDSIIIFVDQLIEQALVAKASDIHIEPYAEVCRIRLRCDGILHEMATLPLDLGQRILTRLKVISKLDITERRLPQDGRFKLHNVDIRINTCPTFFGEKIVLRLLYPLQHTLSIHTLGLDSQQIDLFLQKISEPQGLILVTGPTGSGKTLTLYSALDYLNSIEKNIATVEDPIEIQLMGINQINIQPKIGLNFATILKTILRQDPDVIMVGEIRDRETAEIAIHAAQTGHLVFTTLHTMNAAEAFIRLKSMGIEPYQIQNTLTLIVAQRLIRKLCMHCKVRDNTYTANMRMHPITYKAASCTACLSGYQGRMGIYELLPITSELSSRILSTPINSPLFSKDFTSLKKSAFNAFYAGITSITEIQRVLGSYLCN